MIQWTQDVLDRLSEAREPHQVLEQISMAARRLGFEHCAYGLRILVPFTRQKTLMLSTYDERWNRRYLDSGYLQIDPTVAHGVHSVAPVVWSEEVFRDVPQMWDEARSFGLRVGWAQSVFEADARVGMLSLARSCEALTKAEMRDKDVFLQWLAITAHRAFCRLLGQSPLAGLPPLTRRQVEVLRWSADGKTSGEVGSILCLSKPTIEFHLRNAMSTLGVPTKCAATARSSQLGFLN